MDLFQYFNPRRFLTAAICWPVFAIILVAALMGANLAAHEAELRARADAERLLSQFATQIRHAIDTSLETQQSILTAAVQLIPANQQGIDSKSEYQHIERLQRQFAQFIWLGLADQQGHLIVTTDQTMQGTNVSACRWFQQGLQGRFLGDTLRVSLLGDSAPRVGFNARSPGFLIAVPMTDLSGQRVGVLAARLSWDWMKNLENTLLKNLESRRSLELLVATIDKVVMLGPSAWLGRTLTEEDDFSEAGAYVVAKTRVPPQLQAGLGWTVMLREDADTALARARLAYRTVFWVVLLSGVITALVVIYVAHNLTRRLATLDAQAHAIQQGTQENLSIPDGTDEIGRIGTTLKNLLTHLQQEKRALMRLNTELEARVAERTARIERLADEARHAAVTRERMRLARELHDTLAHSLMALLTQIRLIRKLRNRLDPTKLDEELERAEDVAATGLTEARAAISQMRHNSVRDEGIGSALQQLLRRFQERSGVSATLHIAPQARALADDRAEIVFRIVEEALNNVERHAGAQTVSVKLQWLELLSAEWSHWNDENSAQIRIEITDDGVGFDPSVPCPGHYGLCGIQEQANLIEARFELHSQPDAGTRLVLEFEA